MRRPDRRRWILPVVGLALLTAACSSGGNGGLVGVDFGQFVVGMIQNTSERTDPIEIGFFEFVIDEDPTQFDEVLP